MTQYCIQTKNLTRQFGEKVALEDFNLEIEVGGIHAIVGSNGAGKTTLFKLLLGVDTPSKGNATLLGEDSQNLSPQTRGKVGFVNDDHTLPTWMTAEQLTNFQRTYYLGWDQEIYKSVIGHFDVDSGQKISSLSRGERAGLSLALALAQKPELLILDEPALGLDVVSKQSFLEALIFASSENQVTTIYCSHQMDEVERVADRLIIMEKGQLKNNSSPEDFVERMSYWIAEFEGNAPSDDSIPGLLTQRVIEGQHHIWVYCQDDSFRDFLTSEGASSITKCDVSLDRAVNAFLSKNHDVPRTNA